MKNPHINTSHGFTLIELIVVIAIFSIITTIALFNQGKLNGSILVTNLAYEIALSVREAQTYGVGVRAGAASGTFEGGYGISFSMSRPNDIILFTDTIDPNSMMDDGEEASRLTIQNQRGNTIVAICRGVSESPCIDGADNSIDELNIIFRRPNPEALFFSQKESVVVDEFGPGPVYIVVNTPSMDNCRVVVVEKTGQIRVDNGLSGLCENESD